MRFIFLVLSLLPVFQAFGQRTCGADHLHQWQLQNDPEYRQREEALERYTQQYLAEGRHELMRGNELLVPVVFHVLYFSNIPSQNISEQRIREQIETFNRDFNAENADTSLIPDVFKPLKGKINIRFVLANRDPLGNFTSGIIRRQTTVTSFPFNPQPTPEGQPMKFSVTGGSDAWDTRFYLNVWVCNLSGGVLGFATFPSSAGTALDGIVLGSQYVGTTGATAPFNRGRTGTHEIGHWLNLRHIWGDANNCTASDFADDTPVQFTSSSGCPSFPLLDQCSPSFPGVMFMNYMDYTNDACMHMFTTGQAARMQAAIDGPRATLFDSKGYIAPLSNDMTASAVLTPTNPQCDNTFIPRATFSNIGSNIIGSFTASYQVDNDPPVSKTVTGTISPGQVVTVTFDESITLADGSYTFRFFSSAPNGSIDPDTKNDTISRIINVGISDIQDLPLSNGFENVSFPTDGWIINNPDQKITWERTERSKRNGAASIFINNFDYDPTVLGVSFGQFDDVISPFLDFSDVQSARLRFNIAAAQFTDLSIANNNWDTLQILVTSDCGASFTKVYEKFRNQLVTVTLPTTVAFFPTSAQWRAEEVNLSQFAGKEKVQIVFRNISHWENNIFLDDIEVSKSTSTGTAVFNLIEGFEIFPNPTKGVVNVRMKDVPNDLSYLEWVNVMGQQVQKPRMAQQMGNTETFNLQGLAPGLYMLRFVFKDGTHAAKKVMLH